MSSIAGPLKHLGSLCGCSSTGKSARLLSGEMPVRVGSPAHHAPVLSGVL